MTVKQRTHEAEIDDQLGSRIHIFLEARCPQLQQLAVATAGDAIFLRGSVGNDYERRLAIACCKRVAGVRQVVDRLRVLDDNEPAAHDTIATRRSSHNN